MLVNIHHDTRAEHRRLLLYGTVFLAVMATLIGLSIASYQKVFTPVTMVELHAGRAGLQLAQFGDVRMHGVLVGQVRSIGEEHGQAVIKVALDPASARTIPDNVSAAILPTTLFGQKFISLDDPTHPSSRPLTNGDVIPASRVRTNVELSQILARLFPLLRAVRPADLNATLNALATALAGRGNQLGRSMDRLDGYLTAMSPHLPTLRQDLVALADVAHTYDLAAPDLLRMLRNLTVTGRTVLAKRAQLGAFFGDIAGLSATGTRVLGDNADGLIELGRLSRPTLALLDTYSPEYPCLMKGLTRYTGRLAQIFKGGTIRQYLEFGAAQRRPYDRRDKPVYGEHGHGPWCLGLPYPPVPIGPTPLKDGSDEDSAPAHSQVPGGQDPTQQLMSSFNLTSGYAGTAAEQRVVNALMAGRTGRPITSFSSMPALLYGPLLRGRVVSG